MRAVSDPALGFWLRWAEGKGALRDDGGDASMVLLPPPMQAELDLPEALTVTADPEVAREDGALLLIPGHPLLDRAADQVLEGGDAGIAHLAWPVSVPPSAAGLEAWARERLGVDHGRIDAGGDPLPAYLPVLRLGAVASFTVSLEERFQERQESWVDASTGLPLGDPVRAHLISSPWEPGPGTARRRLPADLATAMGTAHALLEDRARQRLATVAQEVASAREEELVRAEAYYAATLDAVARRRAGAPAERQALYEAQAQATQVERGRRVAEIDEKFRPRHELRPFRAHVVDVPALVLPVVVRRGERRYPLELTWLPAARHFLDVSCPACGAPGAHLVAGRRHLGCRACLGG